MTEYLKTVERRDGKGRIFQWTGPKPTKDTPKAAGFWWHGPARDCQRGLERCGACAAGVEWAWWTPYPDKATALIEYADAATRALLSPRAESIQASRATDNTEVEIPAPDGLAYLPFQKAGIAFAMKRRSTLFGDEMGLGKTIQALGCVNTDPSVKNVLVVCRASLRLNWMREAQRWLVRPFSFCLPAKSDETIPPTASFVIVNHDKLVGAKGEALRGQLMARDWDCLIIDEAHDLKNPKAKRSQVCLGKEAKKKQNEPAEPGLVSKAKRVLILTGTPLVNKPVELWGLVHACAPEEFPNFWGFAKRYCNATQGRFGWDLSGASNLQELQNRMRSTFMVRRLKKDVLTELPPKRRQVIDLALNGAAAAVQAENEAWEEQEEEVEAAKAEVELAEASGDAEEYKEAVARLHDRVRVAFTEISLKRHATALAKAPAVLDHVLGIMEEGAEKVIIFAHHKDVIAKIEEGLAEYGVRKIVGDTPMEERQANVDSFQTDPAVRCIIGSIGAMGVGLTLTASSTVIFAELDWVPGNVTQAEDRAHRIGQTMPVLVQHLVLDGSLDSRMAKVLVAKQEIADRALDRENVLALPVLPSEDEIARQEAQRKATEIEITPEVREAATAAVQFLAARCDGARTEDAAGFSKIDAGIGRSLAERSRARPLSDGEVRLTVRICWKYSKRQLPQEIVKVIEPVVRPLMAAAAAKRASKAQEETLCNQWGKPIQ